MSDYKLQTTTLEQITVHSKDETHYTCLGSFWNMDIIIKHFDKSFGSWGCLIARESSAHRFQLFQKNSWKQLILRLWMSPPSVPAHGGPDTSTTHSKNFPSLRDDSTIDERNLGNDMFSPVWKSFVLHCLLLSDRWVSCSREETVWFDKYVYVSEQWWPAVCESTASLRCNLLKCDQLQKTSPEDWKLSSFVYVHGLLCHLSSSQKSNFFLTSIDSILLL